MGLTASVPAVLRFGERWGTSALKDGKEKSHPLSLVVDLHARGSSRLCNGHLSTAAFWF